MGQTTIITATFDETLPVHAPPPSVVANLLGRWSAKGLVAPADMPAWAPDLGAAVTPAVGAFTAPKLEEDAGGIVGLHFDTGSQLTYPTTPPAITTTYLVFSLDAIGGHTHTLWTLSNSIQVVVTNTGIVRIDGTTGDNSHPATASAAQRYVAACVVDTTTGSTTLDFLGTAQTVAGFTGEAPDKYKFGAATASYLDGFVYEASVFSVAHDAPTRAAELGRLRAWYAAL